MLTITIINCAQDIVSMWATKALCGQGQAALIKVRGRLKSPAAPGGDEKESKQKQGRQLLLRTAVHLAVLLRVTDLVKLCSQAHAEEPCPLNQPQAHIFRKAPVSVGGPNRPAAWGKRKKEGRLALLQH